MLYAFVNVSKTGFLHESSASGKNSSYVLGMLQMMEPCRAVTDRRCLSASPFASKGLVCRAGESAGTRNSSRRVRSKSVGGPAQGRERIRLSMMASLYASMIDSLRQVDVCDEIHANPHGIRSF